MATLFLLLALFLSTGVAQECLVCIDDGYEVFTSVPGSRYRMPPVELTWGKALTMCGSDGGGSHLAIINSEAEAVVVKELISRLDGTSLPNPWLGINDIAQEGVWRTVQGGLVSASGYNKWIVDRPSVSTEENCGTVFLFPDASYYDVPCADVRPFICEKPNV